MKEVKKGRGKGEKAKADKPKEPIPLDVATCTCGWVKPCGSFQQALWARETHRLLHRTQR